MIGCSLGLIERGPPRWAAIGYGPAWGGSILSWHTLTLFHASDYLSYETGNLFKVPPRSTPE